MPLIERVAAELGALVSVDTYKPAVARAAIAAGAAIVNDVSGLRDPELADVCAETGAGAGPHAHAGGAQAEAARSAPRRPGRRRRPARSWPSGSQLALAHGVERRAVDARPRPRLRQDAGPDGRGAARAPRAARARASAAARRLAQGLRRRDHRPRPARAAGGNAGGGRPTASTPARTCSGSTTSRRPPTSWPCGRALRGRAREVDSAGSRPSPSDACAGARSPRHGGLSRA